MGGAFIHSIGHQSTALTAHHPNKSEHVCGFHSLLSGSCHGRPDVSHHNKTLSLFIPVTSHHGEEKRCLKSFRGRNGLQSLRKRQTHSMPRPPSLQRAKRYSGRPGASRAVAMTGLVRPIRGWALHVDTPAKSDGDQESRMDTQKKII